MAHNLSARRFSRIERLPPYVFNITAELKMAGRRRGEDFSMGNPDGPTPAHIGSQEFARRLLQEAKVCVSPGIGFGEYGDTHVRFALIENCDRIRQAVRGIKSMFRADGIQSGSIERERLES